MALNNKIKYIENIIFKIWSLFTKNLSYKLLAILLGGLAWFIVQGEEILEINRKIEVHIEVPKGYVVQGENIRYKDATLSGSRALLGDFPTTPLQAKIRVQTPGSRKAKVLLTKQHLDVWNNRIKITIHDAYVEFFIDEEMSKKVPVKEMVHGLPKEGFMIEKTQLNPKMISITGLKSIVKEIDFIQTQPIDIDQIHESKVYEIGLLINPSFSIKTSVESVNVAFQVGEKRVNQSFHHIPIDLEPNNLSKYFEIHPRFINIDLQGTPSSLDIVKKNDLRAFIDVSSFSKLMGPQEVKVQVKIPTDTILIETKPEIVMIRSLQKR